MRNSQVYSWQAVGRGVGSQRIDRKPSTETNGKNKGNKAISHFFNITIKFFILILEVLQLNVNVM